MDLLDVCSERRWSCGRRRGGCRRLSLSVPQVQRDIDDHILLAAHRFAFSNFNQDVSSIDAELLGRLVRVE